MAHQKWISQVRADKECDAEGAEGGFHTASLQGLCLP